jgi:hypothetical protein
MSGGLKLSASTAVRFIEAADLVAFFFPAVGDAFGVWLAANESRKIFFPAKVDR